MQTIRLLMEVNSENIHIPELRKFMGKRVEMIIVETPLTLLSEKKNGKMARFLEAAGRIEIDEQAVRQFREVSKL